jgi:hypothetical protein
MPKRIPIIQDSIVLIPLTKNRYAVIDKADYDALPELRDNNWFYHGAGYAWSWLAGKNVLMHRLIMRPMQGAEVDHIDHDGLNNRRSNLRICEHKQNLKNLKRRRAGKSSPYKGVSFEKQTGRWKAQISVDGKNLNLGRFLTEHEAARVYNEAALRLHGEYAETN